jgi:hypothetical protein
MTLLGFIAILAVFPMLVPMAALDSLFDAVFEVAYL